MKLFATGLLVATAVVLGVTTGTGSAAATAHRAGGSVPHHGSAHRAKAVRKTAGFACGAACSAYENAINTYFTNVAADSGKTTNVYGVATEYCQGVATEPVTASCGASPTNVTYSSTFGGSYVDGRTFPKSVCNDTVVRMHVAYGDKYCLTDAQIQTEIRKAIAANNWPTGSSNIFFLFTPAKVGICQLPGNANIKNNPCSTNVFCAYHNATPSKIIYAVVPDDAQIPDGGCDSGSRPVGAGADATLSSVSHEHNEAITDPFLDAWFSTDFNENGDLCAYNFGEPLGTTPGGQAYNQVINGTNYWLQQEYSNAAGGCLQQPGGLVSPILTDCGCSGPLLYNGGSVMTTNTVYAIYWVPVAPANTVLPKITGTTKVGKKLTALRGTWSNSPKGYTYQWLRCSSTGTSCKNIPLATASLYTLVKADAGHELEVRVTATNMAGGTSATSAPSHVVTK